MMNRIARILKWDPDPDEVLQESNRNHLIKVAHYCEIRDRMKKSGITNPLELALEEKDDPVKPKRLRR